MKVSDLYKIITTEGDFLGRKSNGDFKDVIPYKPGLDSKYFKTRLYHAIKTMVTSAWEGRTGENLDDLCKLPKGAKVIKSIPIEKLMKEKGRLLKGLLQIY